MRKKLVNRMTVQRYRRDFSVFFDRIFDGMIYFSFSPLLFLLFLFFFLFFFTIADCLAHVGQAIIRTFVSRYRKWMYDFTHALPLNNNYYYYEPGYQSYGYRDPLSQITETRWHVQWERGEFEKREENKRRRISLSSLDVNAYEETIMSRRNYMLEVSFALLWKNRYYVNWTARKIGSRTDCVSFPAGRMIFPKELTFLAKCTYAIFKSGYSSVAFMFDNFEQYNWKYGSLWTLFRTSVWNRIFCSIIITY